MIYLFASFMLLAQVDCCVQADQQTEDVSGISIKLIPNNKELLVFDATVNGHQANFMFDTGSFPNVVDQSLQNVIQEPSVKHLPSSKYQYCSIDNLKISSLKSSLKIDLCIADISALSEVVDVQIDGIAGSLFFANRAFRIDCQKSLFFVFDDKFDYGSEIYKVMDISLDAMNRPWVKLVIYDREVKFLIDTGFTGAIDIEKSIYRRLEKGGQLTHGGTLEALTASGLSSQPYGFLGELAFADFNFENVPATLSDTSSKIGIDLLKRFTFVLDFKQEKLVLEKNELANPSFRNYALGSQK